MGNYSIVYTQKEVINFCKETKSTDVIKLFNKLRMIRELAQQIISGDYDDKMVDEIRQATLHGLYVVLNEETRILFGRLYELGVREIIFENERDLGSMAAANGINVIYKINDPDEEIEKEEEKNDDEENNRENKEDFEAGEKESE